MRRMFFIAPFLRPNTGLVLIPFLGAVLLVSARHLLEAGPRVAAIISIVETCRRLSLPIRDYLSSVLPGLADFPINRVAELTPSAWAARN
jgi:hypothetical protein